MPPTAGEDVSGQADFDSRLEEAKTRHRAGRVAEAEATYALLNRQVPDHPEPWHMLAVVAHQQGSQERAAELAEKAIARSPGTARYHNTLGSALRLLARGQEAERAFRQALNLDRDNPLYAGNLAVALLDRGAAAEALDAATQFQRPGSIDPSLENVAGLALQRLGRFPESLSAFDRALAAAPGNADLASNRRVVLLQMGEAAAAAAAARSWLAGHPADSDALTHLAAAHAQAGARAELADLVRLDSHVCPFVPALADGSRPDAAFNAVLAHHCLTHPTLQEGRHNKATQGGGQTDDLTLGAPPELLELLAALERAAVALARDHAAASPGHPWAAHAPARWRLRVWATVLRRGGHQRPHTHPAGWMSGVYYVAMPEAPQPQEPRAGWIEFGRPDSALSVTNGYDLRDIQPIAGQGVLFPSFVWHRTHPFAGGQPRISIAFDFLPLP